MLTQINKPMRTLQSSAEGRPLSQNDKVKRLLFFRS